MFDLKNPVIRGSLILVTLVGLFNFLNFLYQLAMAHILPVTDFGLLKRVFVFLYLGAVVMESMQTLITKYAAGENNKGKIKNLFKKSFKKSFRLSFVLFASFMLIAIFISQFFKIPYSLLSFAGVFLIGSMLVPISRAILQGQRRFYALGFSIISEGVLKVVLSLLLVLMGFGVYGAVGGVVISIFLSLLISLIYMRDILSHKEENIELKGIREYSWPVITVTLVMILFFNVDVLLAGYFFDDFISGTYAIISTIALIIFVGVQPINKVLFPISVDYSNKKISSSKNFFKALSLILVLAACALFIIAFYPELLIQIVSGKNIPEAETPLLLLSLGIIFLSVTSSILYYKLSQGKTKRYQLIPLFLIAEIFLLSIFSSSLSSFAFAFLASNILFFIGSLLVMNK